MAPSVRKAAESRSRLWCPAIVGSALFLAAFGAAFAYTSDAATRGGPAGWLADLSHGSSESDDGFAADGARKSADARAGRRPGAPKEVRHASVDELWEVAHAGRVEVRRAPSSAAPVLDAKGSRAVVVGSLTEDGEWIKLAHGEGYMRTALGDPATPLLRRSSVAFTALIAGTCANIRLSPIKEWSTCEAAAFQLKLRDTSVELSDHSLAPEGCYVYRGKLLLSAGVASRGKGVVPGASGDVADERRPLCSNQTQALPLSPPDEP